MNYEYYDKFINKDTIGRYDITPIFGNPVIFNNLIKDLLEPLKKN